MYFVPGDRQRLDLVRAQQAGLSHPDERFMLDAPVPAWQAHRSVTADPGVNAVLSGLATLGMRQWTVFFKPLLGVAQATARAYGQDSVVDVGLHEVVAWRLAKALGPPWSTMVAPAVWLDPPGASNILHSGPILLGMGGGAELPQPGAGFEQLVSDAAFFDALIGAQDRHDQNLRAAMPAKLGLIDHGYAFACPGDIHNGYPTAGFFIRLRSGERVFHLSHGITLDYSGLGALSPHLASHETAALTRLEAAADLLGVADLLPHDRADALRDRTRRMLAAQQIMGIGDF
jgi:hypothetical protein